jgi:small conductance mechanosensitive channel
VNEALVTDVERVAACGEDPGRICDWVIDQTGSTSLAQAVDMGLDRPIRVLIIIAVALIASRLARWFINRIGRRLAERSLRQLAQIERRTPRNVREVLERLDREDDDGDDGQADASPVSEAANASVVSSDEDALALGRLKLRIDTMVSVLSSLATVAVWAVAAATVLSQFDVNLAPLFAGAGVVGIALGFGAQSVVADFLSGFFMLFEDQYGIGDVVDLGDASGTVEKFSLRTTTIRDVNGVVWHIPNSEIRRVGNKSQLWSRAVLDIDVAYDTDIRRAEGIIQRVADDLWHDSDYTDGGIMEAPQVWGVERLGADGVSIRLVVKTDPADQWTVGRELRLRIKEALDEAGIEIPFPQRTIWLRHDEAPTDADRAEVPTAPLRLPDASEDLVDNPD